MITVPLIAGSVVLLVWTYELWQFLGRKGLFYSATQEYISSRTGLTGEKTRRLEMTLSVIIVALMALSIIALGFILFFVS